MPFYKATDGTWTKFNGHIVENIPFDGRVPRNSELQYHYGSVAIIKVTFNRVLGGTTESYQLQQHNGLYWQTVGHYASKELNEAVTYMYEHGGELLPRG